MTRKRSSMARFEDTEIQRIRRLYDTNKKTQVELASEYKCGLVTIGRIVRRESYKDVPEL